MDQSIHTG